MCFSRRHSMQRFIRSHRRQSHARVMMPFAWLRRVASLLGITHSMLMGLQKWLAVPPGMQQRILMVSLRQFLPYILCYDIQYCAALWIRSTACTWIYAGCQVSFCRPLANFYYNDWWGVSLVLWKQVADLDWCIAGPVYAVETLYNILLDLRILLYGKLHASSSLIGTLKCIIACAGKTVEMHGSITQIVCTNEDCNLVLDMDDDLLSSLAAKKDIPCPKCKDPSMRCRIMLYDDKDGASYSFLSFLI